MNAQPKSKTAAALLLSIVALMWIVHTLTKNFVTDPGFTKLLAARDVFAADRSLWLLMLRAHIVLAIVSLITGPLGVIRNIRQRAIALHRWNGRIYAFSVVLNFIPGLYVSWYAPGGWTAASFLVLNALWLATTLLGIAFACKGELLKHSRWMTRSFFLTYANLAIHLFLPVGQHMLGLSYAASYTVAVWGSMTLTLSLAEITVRKKWLS